MIKAEFVTAVSVNRAFTAGVALGSCSLKGTVKLSNAIRSVFGYNQIQRLLVFTKILVLSWLAKMERVGQWPNVDIEAAVSIASI